MSMEEVLITIRHMQQENQSLHVSQAQNELNNKILKACQQKQAKF